MPWAAGQGRCHRRQSEFLNDIWMAFEPGCFIQWVYSAYDIDCQDDTDLISFKATLRWPSGLYPVK